jgi:hypothetical protein
MNIETLFDPGDMVFFLMDMGTGVRIMQGKVRMLSTNVYPDKEISIEYTVDYEPHPMSDVMRRKNSFKETELFREPEDIVQSLLKSVKEHA